MLYAVSLAVTGTGFLLLRMAIHRRLRMGKQLLPADISAERKHWVSIALYVASVPAALFHPRLALCCDALVTVIWILPGLGIRDPGSDGAELEPAAGTTSPLRPALPNVNAKVRRS